MSLFLINKHNLGDVQDVVKARKNLGINAVYEPNNVDITGGSISVNDFRLYGDGVEDYYMMCDSNGRGSWRQRTTDALTAEINISTFLNNVPYLTQGYVENSFLQMVSNLADVSDPVASVSNLGLGFLLGNNITIDSKIYKEFDNLIMDNQIISENLEVRGDFVYPQAHLSVNNILSLDSSFKMVSFEMMNDSEQIFNNNVIIYGTKKPVSANLLKDVYANVNERVNTLNATIDNLVTGSFYTRKDLNLSDVHSVESARSNLGFGSYIIDNSTLKVGDLYALNSFTMSGFNVAEMDVDRLGGTVLTADDDGRGTWKTIPIASFSNHGIVRTSMDFVNDSVEANDQIVPTVHALREYLTGTLTEVFTQINAIQTGYLFIDNKFSEYKNLEQVHRNTLLDNLNIKTSNIQDFPSEISVFNNDVGYLRIDNMLSELVGPSLNIVQSNLAFSAVAVSGEYMDLLNIPNSFSNYLFKASNLLDVNSLEARSNLGLGNFATMDSSDVLIEGGVLRSINSIQTNEFIFTSNIPDYNALSNILFLKAGGVDGMAVWAPLPYASFTQVGILKLVTDYWDQHSDNSTYSSRLVHSNLSELTSNLNAFQTSVNEQFSESNMVIEGNLTLNGNLIGNQTVHIDSNLSVSGDLTIGSLHEENSLLYIAADGTVEQSLQLKQNSDNSCGLTFEPNSDSEYKFRILVEGSLTSSKFIIAKQQAVGSQEYVSKHIFR